MPKAAMNVNGGSILRENNVRAARQLTGVKTVAISKAVKVASDGKLGHGVLAANARHHSASGRFVNYVSH